MHHLVEQVTHAVQALVLSAVFEAVFEVAPGAFLCAIPPRIQPIFLSTLY